MHNGFAQMGLFPMVDKPPPPAPTASALHDAALRHLARYATTAAGLLRVLDRRIMRWARVVVPDDDAVATARAAARAEIPRLIAAGLLDDAVFAATRAQSLSRAGKSRRGIAAHLAARGVAASVAQPALPDDPDVELAAAIALARRRRVGPFGATPLDPVQRARALGSFARAGFSQDMALRALGMDRADAEAVLHRLRQG